MEGNEYHFTFALFALNQDRGGRKSFFCSSDQCVTHLHPSVQADLFPRHKEQQRLSFLLHRTLHRCVAQARSPDTAHLLYGEFASSAPCTPSKCACAGGSSQPVRLFGGRQRVRVQAVLPGQGREMGQRKIISEHSRFFNAFFFLMLLIKGWK